MIKFGVLKGESQRDSPTSFTESLGFAEVWSDAAAVRPMWTRLFEVLSASGLCVRIVYPLFLLARGLSTFTGWVGFRQSLVGPRRLGYTRQAQGKLGLGIQFDNVAVCRLSGVTANSSSTIWVSLRIPKVRASRRGYGVLRRLIIVRASNRLDGWLLEKETPSKAPRPGVLLLITPFFRPALSDRRAYTSSLPPPQPLSFPRRKPSA